MKIKRLGEWDYMMIIIWLIIWLPILIWCIIGTYSDLKKHLIETTWTVSHIWVYHRSENSDIIKYSISATYDCWSKKWIEWDSIGSTGHYYEIGDKITLYCDENEPQLFTFNKPFDEFLIHVLWWLAFWMPWFILSLIWIIRVIKQNKRKKIKQKSEQFGTKIEATIVDIYQSNLRFDYKPWFKIVAKYWNHKYISEDIYADIYYVLNIWDKIDIFVDESSESKYISEYIYANIYPLLDIWDKIDINSQKNDKSKYFIDIDGILERNNEVKKIKINKNWGYEILGWWIFIFIFSILIFKDISKSNCSKSNWSDESKALVLFIIIASFLILLWTIRVVKQIKRKKLNQELEQFGTKIEATVLLQLVIPRKRKNWGNKYIIVAKHNKETFLSDEYYKPFNDLIKKWDKIDIYLDNMNHSKYYMALPTEK